MGTSTEIYEYLRLLYARVGHTFSPVSGNEVKCHTVQNVVDCALGYSEGTRFTVLAPMRVRPGRTLREQLETDLQQGLSRLDIDGEPVRIEDYLQSSDDVLRADEAVMRAAANDATATQTGGRRICLLIDRLAVSNAKETLSRLADSVQTAFFEGDGECMRAG